MFSEIYYFDKRMYLCIFEGLFEGVCERMNLCWCGELRDFYGEVFVYIVMRVECNVLNFSSYEGIESVI